MEEVRFENEQEYARPSAAAQGPRGLIALVMKWGLARDEKTARYVLLGVVLVCTIVMLMVWLGAGKKGATKLSPNDIQRITNLQTGLSQPQ